MAGVFEGLSVLDLSWGTAGPMTTMFLVDNDKSEIFKLDILLQQPVGANNDIDDALGGHGADDDA